jgi:hypothetical protein
MTSGSSTAKLICTCSLFLFFVLAGIYYDNSFWEFIIHWDWYGSSSISGEFIVMGITIPSFRVALAMGGGG